MVHHFNLPHINLNHIVSHVEHDVSSTANWTAQKVGSAGKFVINSELQAMKIGSDTVKSLGSSLSMPLVIAGVGALAIFLMMQQNKRPF